MNGLTRSGPAGLASLRHALVRQSGGGDREALVIVVDGSGSMNELFGGKIKTDAVREAVEALVSRCTRATSMGLVKFGNLVVDEYGGPRVLCPVTDNLRLVATCFKRARPEGTYLAPGLKLAESLLGGRSERVKRAIVLSDGCAFDGPAVLKPWPFIVDTVFFGDDPEGERLLAELAKIGGGVFYHAADAQALMNTFKQLDAKTRGLLTGR